MLTHSTTAANNTEVVSVWLLVVKEDIIKTTEQLLWSLTASKKTNYTLVDSRHWLILRPLFLFRLNLLLSLPGCRGFARLVKCSLPGRAEFITSIIQATARSAELMSNSQLYTFNFIIHHSSRASWYFDIILMLRFTLFIKRRPAHFLRMLIVLSFVHSTFKIKCRNVLQNGMKN